MFPLPSMDDWVFLWLGLWLALGCECKNIQDQLTTEAAIFLEAVSTIKAEVKKAQEDLPHVEVK